MGRKKRSGLAEPKAPASDPDPPLCLAECLCPICQELLVEPVTPPCGHSLCRGCFQQTVEISNLSCPLCRRRLSNWARAQARAGSLVDTRLEERIRRQFPHHRSEEPSEVVRLCPPPQLCKPGEVRQEFEEQISKLKAERHAREEEEHRASEEFIQKLLAEEQEQEVHMEQQRKEMDEQLKRDEKLAKMLSEEIISLSKTLPESLSSRTRQISSKPNSSSVTKGIKLTAHNPSHTGDIQRYLSPISQKYQIAETSRQRSSASATESKCTDADGIISFQENSGSFANTCAFRCEDEEEQEPVSSSAESVLAQCIEGTPTAAITDCQQIGEHNPEDNENEMAGVCSSVRKGRERCKEDVPLTELKVNSINSNGENDLLDSAIVPILSHKLDYAHTSTSHCGSRSIDCAEVHCDEGVALQKPIQDQGTKHKIVNQIPIKLKTVVKRKMWTSSEVDGETCFTVKKKKVCPNVHNEPSETTPLSHGIFHEDQLSEWEKKQFEKQRMEEQDRLLALQIQKELDKEMQTVNRTRGSPDAYLLRTNKSPPTNCEKRVLAKNQNPLETRKGRRTSKSLWRSQCNPSKLGKKQTTLTDSSPTTSRRKSRIRQHPASEAKNRMALRQRPLNCTDGNSAALIPVDELTNSNKQQTIVEMFQKHATK
ncbi:E3 ubiquitin-protein ligase rnf168-like [Heptranchias perlo]|uniref:E3 ubiquitin-protein ligase rnf168-like n=1 Tax=Heptranchias perlo TaxID=212740 RepID=UPI003559445A